jgi:hypothetical protein
MEELTEECWHILDSAVLGGDTGMRNAAERMAALLKELTANTGLRK